MLSANGITSGELKWTKVSRGKLHAYMAAIDYHFDRLVADGAECHALIVDTTLLDHDHFNQGDDELGFNKFMFQLLYHRVGKRFGVNERITVDLDARNTNRDVAELQMCLNRKVAKEFGMPGHWPFSRVAHRDSKGSRLIQIADLLSGAVAWHMNAHDAAPNASEAKTALALHIAKRIGLRRLGRTSPYGEARLSMWNLKLSSRKSRPAV